MTFPVCSACQKLGVYQHLPSKVHQYDISSVREGRSDEIPVEVDPSDHSARACCLVSRHSVSVGQNSSSNPKNPGSTRYSQVRTWEERIMNSGCCSDQRTSEDRELRGVQKILEVCLSHTQASGHREHAQKIFQPKQC